MFYKISVWGFNVLHSWYHIQVVLSNLGFVNLFIPLCATCVLNTVGVVGSRNSYLQYYLQLVNLFQMVVQKEMASRNDCMLMLLRQWLT